MRRKKQEKHRFRKPLQSTQQNLPIRGLYRGIVLTKDERYVKILEVLPVPFLLLTAKEQAETALRFETVLKSAPHHLQITVMTFSADLSKEKARLLEAMKQEHSPECRMVDEEYLNRMQESEQYGLSRRFFLSFEYERNRSVLFQKETMEEIALEMERTASVLASALRACGNEVLDPPLEEADEASAEILYTILHRSEYRAEPFAEHLSRMKERYAASSSMQTAVPIADLLAPKFLSFMDKRYVRCGGTWSTYYCIASDGYSQLVQAGWLTPFFSACPGVDLNLFLERKEPEEVMNSIRRNMTYAQTDMASVSYASEAMDVSSDAFASTSYIRDGMLAGQDFCYLMVLFSISGKDAEETARRAERLCTRAKQSGLKLRSCEFEEEHAFFSGLPLVRPDPSLFEKTKRNVLTEGAASTYPFTAFELHDPGGVYLGDDPDTGGLVIADLFDEKRLTNYNLFIEGTSGAGKSYALSLLAIRLRTDHVPVYLLAPEKEDEFRRMCSGVGGQFIELAPGSKDRINIMEIRPRDERAEISAEIVTGSEAEGSRLAEKVDTLKNFFSLLITDMTIEERQLLDNALMKVYSRFGITEDNRSLIDPSDPAGRRYRRMPIIGDLVQALYESSETRRMAGILSFFTTGSGRSFNGETNVDLQNEFIVFGLEKMKAQLLKVGLYIALDFAWAKVREDRFQDCALMMDEAWTLLQDPVCAEYAMKISKTIRSYHGSYVVSTQQLRDILAVENGQYGMALIGNCATKILMRTESSDSATVRDLLHLSEEDTRLITRLERGNALLLTGGIRMQIRFQASRTEHFLITNAQEDLRMILAEKEKQEKEAVRNSARGEEKPQLAIALFSKEEIPLLLKSEDSRVRMEDPVLMLEETVPLKADGGLLKKGSRTDGDLLRKHSKAQPDGKRSPQKAERKPERRTAC